MKHTNYLLGLGLCTLLVGCGDVSSNHKMGTNKNPERSTQGVEGSNGDDNLRSHIHREKGAAVLSYAEEITKTISNTLSDKNYRIVPVMETDSEGSTKNVSTVSQIGRPTVTCGVANTFAGIDARITDCFQKNGDKALWEGFRYASAGEGTWKLVALDSNTEIWFDGRSGMVWSEVKAVAAVSTFNWCKASGNQTDESNIGGVDCNSLADKDSICVGLPTLGIENQIRWRLPTRNDFLQADLNGLRFVHKKETAGVGLWTATMVAGVSGRTDAWIYNSSNGTLSSDKLSTLHSVRCIGAPDR